MFWHIPFKIIIPRLPALTLGLLHESYSYTKHVVCGVVCGAGVASRVSILCTYLYSVQSAMWTVSQHHITSVCGQS